MIIFIRTFNQLCNLYLLENYTYYNVIFKNISGYTDNNVLYITYEIYFH